MRLLDPGAEMGRSNAEVVTYAKKVGHRKDEEIAAHVEEEKHLAMKRIYFRLVDPQYPVPTRKDFMEFVHGQKVVEQPFGVPCDSTACLEQPFREHFAALAGFAELRAF